MSAPIPIGIPLSRRRNDSIPLSPMCKAIEKIKYPKYKNGISEATDTEGSGSDEISQDSSFELKASCHSNGTSRFRKDAIRVSGGGGESDQGSVQKVDIISSDCVG